MKRKRNKTCIVCGKQSVGRVCRNCYQKKSNRGNYKREFTLFNKEIDYEIDEEGINFSPSQYSIIREVL